MIVDIKKQYDFNLNNYSLTKYADVVNYLNKEDPEVNLNLYCGLLRDYDDTENTSQIFLFAEDIDDAYNYLEKKGFNYQKQIFEIPITHTLRLPNGSLKSAKDIVKHIKKTSIFKINWFYYEVTDWYFGHEKIQFTKKH